MYKQQTNGVGSTKTQIETKSETLNENKTFSILEKNNTRDDAIAMDQAPTEKTKHIAPDISIASKMKQQSRDWAKLKPMIGLEPEDLEVSAPTASINLSSINRRALDLAAAQTKIPKKNSITRLKQSDKETPNSCEVSNVGYKRLDLETINAVIKSKTTQIGQLLGQKLYPHQIARNQNIGNLLAQQHGRQAQQQTLGTLSIHQLIALRNMAARQQIFLCR